MHFTASQIAAIAGGVIEGNGDAVVNSFAKIEEGHEGAISFLANPKYTQYIYTTGSSVVLVANDFIPEKPLKCTLIRVEDPYATVAALLEMVSKMMEPNLTGIEQPCFIAEGVAVPEDAYIGAFAYIGKGAVIGAGAKIYPNAYVGANVSVGDATVIYPDAVVYHNCKIGKRCIIHSGAVIGADGFGFAPVDGHYNKIPQIGIVEIEDDVEIGANTTVDRATMGHTLIKRGTKLDNLIQVAHNCVIGQNTVMAAQAGIAGSTKIGDNCMVGGQVGFKGHVTIGNNVMIGAQSGISGNARDNSRLMGSPAVDMGKYVRQAALSKNLPWMFERIKDLEKRIVELENK
ncbi:MAG: UDP-3-O-(3-hydroxymyristoyl)glucosamine N-acyltransferase [Bacteroidales bacterium]|nr:UDP-3-O-(3-hydroxymyristoyl)glucosamine N-acyltransferase [Bacteroidales bacterium]